MTAAVSLLALPARHQAGDRMRGWSLAALRTMHPDLVLETWVTVSGAAIVDLIRVPEHLRRRDLGSALYRAWERTLAPGTTVELFAVDADASAFWRTLGFEGEDNSRMRRTVGGEVAESCAA